jgi:hypothetical protein
MKPERRGIWRLIDKINIYRYGRIIKKAGLLNPQWYLQHNPDVAKARMDPVRHYITHGWREGRDPSPDFSTSEYPANRPEVVASGMFPLVHKILHWD